MTTEQTGVTGQAGAGAEQQQAQVPEKVSLPNPETGKLEEVTLEEAKSRQMLQADYTRGKQELARQREQLNELVRERGFEEARSVLESFLNDNPSMTIGEAMQQLGLQPTQPATVLSSRNPAYEPDAPATQGQLKQLLDYVTQIAGQQVDREIRRSNPILERQDELGALANAALQGCLQNEALRARLGNPANQYELANKVANLFTSLAGQAEAAKIAQAEGRAGRPGVPTGTQPAAEVPNIKTPEGRINAFTRILSGERPFGSE